MSSTARGSQRSEADNYPTPSWVIHRFLERCPLPGGLWLESSAGNGGIIKAVNQVRNDVTWTAVELRKECRPALLRAGVKGNTLLTGSSFLDVPKPLSWQGAGRPIVSLNNVPFSLAMEFIEHSLAFAPYVVHLLRLNFFGTERRNKFFQDQMPDVFVIPDRVSFTGDGRADSIEYMLALWRPERNRKVGQIQVLDHTPLDERKA